MFMNVTRMKLKESIIRYALLCIACLSMAALTACVEDPAGSPEVHNPPWFSNAGTRSKPRREDKTRRPAGPGTSATSFATAPIVPR